MTARGRIVAAVALELTTESTDTGVGLTARVTGVFVGRPGVIGHLGGRPVESGIAKSPVTGDELALARLNLDGDGQADLTVHGGVDKAVYTYPADHYPLWQADGFDVEPGGLGENVALAGVTEHDTRIGDRWTWGDAVVEVSQPRAPCFKLALHTGRKDIGGRMQATGRSGWYVRVLTPGTVPTRGPMTLVERPYPDGPTVAEAFAVIFHPRAAADPDLVDRVVASPALAESWRLIITSRQA
jgi:MOSC domain-containing protein YiiM